jgi:hypothetical protein
MNNILQLADVNKRLGRCVCSLDCLASNLLLQTIKLCIDSANGSRRELVYDDTVENGLTNSRMTDMVGTPSVGALEGLAQELY